MKPTTALCVLVAALLVPLCASGSDWPGSSAGAFMVNGAGARAIAMGRSFTAVADDASAVLWNPAGLTRLESGQFLASASVLSEDRTQNYAGLALPVWRGAVCAGWLRYGVAEIQERDGQGNLIGSFDDAENAFLLGVGVRVYESERATLGFGATIKHLRHTLYDAEASGLTGDWGWLFSWDAGSPIGGISLGFAEQNVVGGNMTWDTESGHEDEVPGTRRAGVTIGGHSAPFLVALDLHQRKYERARFHFGAEYRWGRFAVRAGLDDGSLAGGIGYAFDVSGQRLVLDYAVAGEAVSDGPVHLGTLTVLF